MGQDSNSQNDAAPVYRPIDIRAGPIPPSPNQCEFRLRYRHMKFSRWRNSWRHYWRHTVSIHTTWGTLRPSTQENIVLKYQIIATRTGGEETFWKCGQTDRQTDTSTDNEGSYSCVMMAIENYRSTSCPHSRLHVLCPLSDHCVQST